MAIGSPRIGGATARDERRSHGRRPDSRISFVLIRRHCRRSGPCRVGGCPDAGPWRCARARAGARSIPAQQAVRWRADDPRVAQVSMARSRARPHHHRRDPEASHGGAERSPRRARRRPAGDPARPQARIRPHACEAGAGGGSRSARRRRDPAGRPGCRRRTPEGPRRADLRSAVRGGRRWGQLGDRQAPWRQQSLARRLGGPRHDGGDHCRADAVRRPRHDVGVLRLWRRPRVRLHLSETRPRERRRGIGARRPQTGGR